MPVDDMLHLYGFSMSLMCGEPNSHPVQGYPAMPMRSNPGLRLELPDASDARMLLLTHL